MQPTLILGQQLFWVFNNNARRKQDVTVKKIGRKWAELDNGYRIDLITWFADGKDCSSPGKCYLSKEVFDAELRCDIEWSNFRRSLSFNLPKDCTIEKIKEARRILGIL